MALHIGACPRAVARAALLTPHTHKHSLNSNFKFPNTSKPTAKTRIRLKQDSRIRVSNHEGSNMDMSKNEMEQERKEVEFQRIPENSATILNENDVPSPIEDSGELETEISVVMIGGDGVAPQKGARSESSRVSQSGRVGNGAPGPDFWSWTPPSEFDLNYEEESPPPFPPRQSLILDVEKMEVSTHEEEKRELDDEFPANAEEVAYALNNVNNGLSEGVNPDGSRWWKETRIERRPDGVVCRWTLTRGVSADKPRGWEEKYWKASDEFGYKELGSQKSGRDTNGNVWHEFWKESKWQYCGQTHQKTANKWGKNQNGDEWQQKWWEKYDASGQLAEKWAHKWCKIDPSRRLELGRAHVWHERWGEKYDGQGSSKKYADKWAKRFEGDGWSKWGEKWDEHFDSNDHRVKQGETLWQDKYGGRWNRTWGEVHHGSGLKKPQEYKY